MQSEQRPHRATGNAAEGGHKPAVNTRRYYTMKFEEFNKRYEKLRKVFPARVAYKLTVMTVL